MATLSLAPNPPVVQSQTLPNPLAHDLDADRRWTAWVVKGHVQDARMRRQVIWIMGLIVVSYASWSAWALAR